MQYYTINIFPKEQIFYRADLFKEPSQISYKTFFIKSILEEIYNHNKLPHIYSKLIFKRLMLKLAAESTYIFQSQFYKQTEGCTMGGPLSATFSNIYLAKLEKGQVKPLKPF